MPPATKKQKIATFADPTYDTPFKKLFGQDTHQDVLVSLLNSLLGFTGNKAITAASVKTKTITQEAELIEKDNTVSLGQNELINQGIGEVKSTVDLLCTTKNGQKIIVEMQKQYAPYFLARTELYMAKIIAGQVQSGMSSKAHEVMLDTYILSIGKEDIFKRSDAIAGDNLYEKTVVPMIKELNVEMPSNKMHWKFYELERFQRICDNEGRSIHKDSSIKDQWLSFMLHCHEQASIPEDVESIIQKAYEIMKTANWPEAERLKYEMEIDEEDVKQQQLEYVKAESIAEGIAEGEAKGKAESAANTIFTLLNTIDDQTLAKAVGIKLEQLQAIKTQEDKSVASITEFLLSGQEDINITEQNVDLTGDLKDSGVNDLES